MAKAVVVETRWRMNKTDESWEGRRFNDDHDVFIAWGEWSIVHNNGGLLFNTGRLFLRLI